METDNDKKGVIIEDMEPGKIVFLISNYPYAMIANINHGYTEGLP